MGKFDAFCDNGITNPSQAEFGELPRTISDISNVERSGAKKLKEQSVVEKYRSVYLEKYVKGVNRRRHRKKLFVVPVFHVSRRPDNPFNVKNAVQNLKRKQMTCPADKTSDQNLLSPDGDKVYYSNLEDKLAKSRNWESIRYKYQLDYKEKLKMERENFLKEYGNMKKMSHKNRRLVASRPHYQNTDERINELSSNVTPQNDQLIMNPLQRMSHPHIDEAARSVGRSSSETQGPAQSLSGRLNNAVESMKYYSIDGGMRNVSVESVDLTTDCENSISVSHSDLKKIRLVRNERENDIPSEINHRNKIMNDEATVVVVPGNSVHEDFDFSIPYKESNILIKVMTGAHQPSTPQQETLQCDTEPKPEVHSLKRVSFDEEPKASNNRSEPGSSKDWLQYLQNILNKTCDPQAEYFKKKSNFNLSEPVEKQPQISATIPRDYVDKAAEKQPQTSATIPRDYVNNQPIQSTATVRKQNVIKVNTAGSLHLTNYNEPPSIGRIKRVQPSLSNPRVVRPKVIHPSPYFRSDTFGNNSQYNDQVADPMTLSLPIRPHSPARLIRRPSPSQMMPQHSPTRLIRRHSPDPLIPERLNLPPHMEYVYGNHPNYNHDFMFRNNRLPLDVSHTNLIGPPVYSPYDQSSYMQYRNEMERIPQPRFIDPYMQHSMPISPINRTIGFLPPRPSAPGVYRYLNPQQHVHPVWIYPHMLER